MNSNAPIFNQYYTVHIQHAAVLYMYELHFLTTINTNVLYITCVGFPPDDSPQRDETCSRL